MHFCTIFILMLTSLLFLLSSVDGAVYRHKHHHDDRLIARARTSSLSITVSTSAVGGDHESFFPGSATPCSSSTCATAVPTSSNMCPASNGTAWTKFATAQNYTVICDVDFPAQNIYPFVLAASFEACMAQCESYNTKAPGGDIQCEGFVFAPDRVDTGDNCYLKSSLDRPSSATITLIGATRVPPFASTVTSVSKATGRNPSPATFTATSSSISLSPPKVGQSQLHGASVNKPTTQWVYHNPATPMKLESGLLVPGINNDLITEFEIASDTGPLRSDSSPLMDKLVDLSVIPHLSRDGGKGGELNGQHLFIFCDTASFTTTNATHKGEMVGFTSSSVAVDDGWNGISGKPLSLVDGIGQWNDDVGRMRGYSPMTHGEESFNVALSGNGYRYAVWPESSIIPLNKTHALHYASLIYDEVNMGTQDSKFTSIGNTLLTISVDEKYGPTAERTAKRLFHQGEVTWGSIGGIRSWGSTGIGAMDGKVYVFGRTPQGVLVARTGPSTVGDRDSYEYWSGNAWTSDQLPFTATSFLIKQPVMDFDLFYSPRHKTFIMVYVTPHADNTFYYRYLQASSAIMPPYADNDHPSPTSSVSDYVEEIINHPWSEEQVLYKADTPPAGNYIYAGSVHAGYFGGDDITKGGTKMLLSWTEHTGEDAASPKSGYAHMTAAVELE